MLAVYGVVAALAYGFLLNLWFWPFVDSARDTELSFVPGGAGAREPAPVLALHARDVDFGWDTGRAITNVIAICVIGPSVLAVLRRAARKAAFDAPVEFAPVDSGDEVGVDLVRLADGDDAAVVDNRHAVATLRGHQPVRDDKHRAAGERALERGGDARLALGVEHTGRLVEHDDGGVGEHHP